MLKNYLSLALLLLLIQSCIPDDFIEEAEMNDQYKVNLEDLDLRESGGTENDSVYNTTDAEGDNETEPEDRG